jgi:hypothetical protein
MRVLVFGEYSGRIRNAFRALGHDAWSCDLLPAEDASDYHLQGDGFDYAESQHWDLIIAHPDCQYLTNSAEWLYRDQQTKNLKPDTLFGAARREAREQAIAFVKRIDALKVKKLCIENPIGVLSDRFRKPDQYIQPYQYGDDASKKTCLWTRGLPDLEATHYVEPRWVVGENGRPLPRWSNQTDSGQERSPPSEDRWKDRSRTFQGWADAMAIQWGGVKMDGRWYYNWNDVARDFDDDL